MIYDNYEIEKHKKHKQLARFAFVIFFFISIIFYVGCKLVVHMIKIQGLAFIATGVLSLLLTLSAIACLFALIAWIIEYILLKIVLQND
ncbi:hypothetical protein Desaci_4750 (plasmid) [Desulfosporosinus acidiphilus SJ4]|uniref:Uncharacterized protein n=1 Tax=Desulfosporosinus acidiphilus (strain DSM 22704 / JCM 16185 / SJ4) TaxID=646529 RepID=I4DCQ2_DESAJ|nr:hypothetical protein [Desulfosporosinus acidiphilus]AFM43576.1 hypothetical protein Desaci_4750 [Desulfosporosinus acidiphilus SJ4]